MVHPSMKTAPISSTALKGLVKNVLQLPPESVSALLMELSLIHI